MPTLRSAPVLKFDTEKPKDLFYQIPQGVADNIFNLLGNASAQLRVMIVLIGTAPGFRVSEQWICDRTGLKPESYIRVREDLERIGWITHTPYDSITVHYDAIMSSTKESIANKSKK